MDGKKSKELDQEFRARTTPEAERDLKKELVESYRQSLKKSLIGALSALESLRTLNHVGMEEYLDLKESLDKVYRAYEAHK